MPNLRAVSGNRFRDKANGQKLSSERSAVGSPMARDDFGGWCNAITALTFRAAVVKRRREHSQKQRSKRTFTNFNGHQLSAAARNRCAGIARHRSTHERRVPRVLRYHNGCKSKQKYKITRLNSQTTFADQLL